MYTSKLPSGFRWLHNTVSSCFCLCSAACMVSIIPCSSVFVVRDEAYKKTVAAPKSIALRRRTPNTSETPRAPKRCFKKKVGHVCFAWRRVDFSI